MSPVLAKCSCSHCDGHLEFDAAYAGERVACPHCGKETLLYIPVPDGPPPIPSPAAPVAYRLADPAGMPIPAPRLAISLSRKSPPRSPNPFARQAAKASWIGFIFAWIFSHMARGPEFRQVFLVTATVFVLIGFTLAVIGLFGIRRYGTKGILIPAVIGLILNGKTVGAMVVALIVGLSQRHELQEKNRQFAASVKEYLQQVKSGAPVKPLPSTGNANVDAGYQIMFDLTNELRARREQMDAGLERLQQSGVCLVLTNKAAIKAELGKRTAAQRIIQQFEQDAAALFQSAKERTLASSMPERMKQDALLLWDKGGQVPTLLDEDLTLRIRVQRAEFDFLQFMFEEFGRYKIINEEVCFAVSMKKEEYNRLSERLKDAYKASEAFERRRSEMLDALPDRTNGVTK
jgi:hypothetical protein